MAKKKPKVAAKLVLFIVLMLTLTAGVFYYVGKPKFVHYNDFGIDIPVNYSIHGIDVSRYQSSINWEDVRTMQIENISIGFCFIKATEGSDDVDGRFKRNWRSAKEAGIIRGAYHFFNPYRGGKAQAQNFISEVKLQAGDMPPVLDVEQAGILSKELLQQRVGEWLTLVEQKYKVKPIIYAGADFYAKYLAGKFDDYPLWVAHYLARNKPRVKRNWIFWQHNEAGHVNGINAYVDFNVFNGDSADFQQLLVK
ncbi:MAG: glycoside hydrolase family 25 protein [Chitinophagaceae bacterium]|nr:glycoside hydrolase family 25 protein [Chitinophagaceae bacterium]